MTNFEKASAIAQEVVDTCVTDNIFNGLVFKAAQLGAIRMGEWKDKQNKNRCTQYDKDMLEAIAYCVKNGISLQQEHLNWIKRHTTIKNEDDFGYLHKFKVGQHIRLKSLPNSNIEIIGISNEGYIYMGCEDGYILPWNVRKTLPFKYENNYEVIKQC